MKLYECSHVFIGEREIEDVDILLHTVDVIRLQLAKAVVYRGCFLGKHPMIDKANEVILKKR